MNTRIWLGSCIVGLSLIVALAGCSKSGTSTDPGDSTATTKPVSTAAPVSAKPVTLKFAYSGGAFPGDTFKQYITDPLKKKYPNITLEPIDYSVKGSELPALIAANIIPDIFINYPSNLGPYEDAGLLLNIDNLIKANNVDLNRITPEFIDAIKAGVNKDYVSSLPINNNAFGLIYNKDLFDKFGVPYPKDNMTWTDAKALGDRISRTADGVQYIGLHPENIARGARQLGLPWFDVKTDQGVFQSADWKGLFQMWTDLYKLPGGIVIPKAVSMSKGFTDGTVAMIGGYSALLPSYAPLTNLNWDVATYPTNPKAPGVGGVADPLIAAISKTSKNQTEAMQVISVLISDEVQLDFSKNALMSILKDQKIQEQFGQGIAGLQKKNVVAFTKPKLAKAQPYKYVLATNPASLANNIQNSIVYDGKDINTALREADEQINQLIQTAAKK